MFAWLLELQGRDLGAHDSANPATQMHLDALETRIRLALPTGRLEALAAAACGAAVPPPSLSRALFTTF